MCPFGGRAPGTGRWGIGRASRRKTAHERTVMERDIEATDRQIDRLVYGLYGLTEEEIGIVEEGTK